MPDKEDIRWFKQQFQTKIQTAVKGTPFSLDMLTAIACQETGYIWSILRKKSLSTAKILELCVGDTIDESGGRSAFPKSKAELLARPNGQQMFVVARSALEDMAKHVPGYAKAVANSAKFCHGFGIFQYDLQFFPTDPEYFLQKRYADFDICLKKCISELKAALEVVVKAKAIANPAKLTDLEMAYVAIAYNTGKFLSSKGLLQGYRPTGGRFYGQEVYSFLLLSKQVSVSGDATPQPGTAVIPPASPVVASGPTYRVSLVGDTLNLRSEPEIVDKPKSNVLAQLPDGQLVKAITNQQIDGFLEVETSLNGALLRGFVALKHIVKVGGNSTIPVVTPSPVQPKSGVVAVYTPRKPGSITRRTEKDWARSLNESGQPARKGTTPAELTAELAKIIEWLAVDKAIHVRYQPQSKATFCNIYAHDYCHLAGVYLPRVWWTPAAVGLLQQGKKVEPIYNKTIDEQRANDLFRWLRSFGELFGWRQTGDANRLQLAVNEGAIGIIVARRVIDGESGHIVAVVPETDVHRAVRNKQGQVKFPLQSQAGAENFRYGTRHDNWWQQAKFAEYAFWLHP